MTVAIERDPRYATITRETVMVAPMWARTLPPVLDPPRFALGGTDGVRFATGNSAAPHKGSITVGPARALDDVPTALCVGTTTFSGLVYLYAITPTYYATLIMGPTPTYDPNGPTLQWHADYDIGPSRWLFSTVSVSANPGVYRALTPLGAGVQLLNFDATRVATCRHGLSDTTTAAFDGHYLYIFDLKQPRAAVVEYHTTSVPARLDYITAFSAPGARQIVATDIDGDSLFVACVDRILVFDISDPTAPTLDETILLASRVSDFRVLGTGKYWVGFEAENTLSVFSHATGPTYGYVHVLAYDATPSVVYAVRFVQVAPKFSSLAISDSAPYVDRTALSTLTVDTTPTGSYP